MKTYIYLEIWSCKAQKYNEIQLYKSRDINIVCKYYIDVFHNDVVFCNN